MAAVAAHIWMVRAPQPHTTTMQEPAPLAAPATAPARTEPSVRFDTRTIIVKPAPIVTLRQAGRVDEAGTTAALQPRPESTDSAVMADATATSGSGSDRDAVDAAASLPPSLEPEPQQAVPVAAAQAMAAPAPLPPIAERITALPPPSPPPREEARRPTSAAAVGSGFSGSAREQRSQEQVVLDILKRHASAYGKMDVAAVKALYPSLDERELRKRFLGLKAQEVQLGDCGVRIVGENANARCEAAATYRPRIGSGVIRVNRPWTYTLSLDDAGWQIVDARMQ